MIIALVDYGAGNLTSVVKGLRAVGASVRMAPRPEDLTGTGAIVIPGVGHFSATRALSDDWRRAVGERIAAGVPLLGICLGLQWLFEGSEEDPDVPGFGLFKGRCFRLPDVVKVPHVGWNTLDPTSRPTRLLNGLPPGSTAYFTHSYAAPPVDATIALTTHGAPFSSAVEEGRVFGTQFHPEKSGATGITLLGNFVAAAQETGPC